MPTKLKIRTTGIIIHWCRFAKDGAYQKDIGGYNDSGTTQHSGALRHVLHLIGILEGPATFDSSLGVS